MTRPILAALLLCCLAPVAMADPIPHTPFVNPAKGDSGDTELTALFKILDSDAGSQTGAAHAAFPTVIATTDGNAVLPARPTRRRVGWINTSSETVYITSTPGATGTTGLTVPAGGTGGMNYTGALYVHGTLGTARVDFCETFD